MRPGHTRLEGFHGLCDVYQAVVRRKVSREREDMEWPLECGA